VIGWRSAKVTFTGALAAATSGTLTAWNYGNGTFTLAFSDGSERQVAMTGTAATWTGAVTASVNANVLLLNGSNVDTYKNRIFVAQNGLAYGNIFEFIDTTNAIRQYIAGGLLREVWTQTWQGSPTGTSYSLPISYPVTYAVTVFTYNVTTALTGPTTLSVGWSGSTTALLNAGAVTTGTNPWTNPGIAAIVVPASSAVLLTPSANITAGVMRVAITAERSQMTQG
jgi:hypothetical protein